MEETDSFIEVLRKKNYQINHFDNIMDIFLATNEIALHLGVKENYPLLHIKQQVLDAANNLIYFNEQFINSKLYKAAIRSY